MASFENLNFNNQCTDLIILGLENSHILNKNTYNAKNFLVGSFGGNAGSMLGQKELEQNFPNRRINCHIVTWNMASKFTTKIDDFSYLVNNGGIYKSELFIFCTQETPNNRREILVQMQSVLGPHYVLFTHTNNGTLDISVFIIRELIWYTSVPQFSHISTRSAVQTKGAVVLVFILFGTSFAFINSHFKANEKNYTQRLQDYFKILGQFDLPKQGLSSGYRQKGDNLMDRFDMVFWCGDLNFRIQKSRIEVDKLLSQENSTDVSTSLLADDELIKAMASGEIFKDFEEGRITFLPTFKYDLNSNKYDSSEKQRVPSYTDRILYKARRKDEVRCTSYNSIQNIKSSDHRPVYGVFNLKLKPGQDNIALSAGAFHREIYIEGNRRRALQFDMLCKNRLLNRSKICSIQ